MDKTGEEQENNGMPVYSILWRQITGQIPVDEYQEWEEFSLQCRRYGIRKNRGGILHMVRVYMKVTKVTFSLADKCHCDPMIFTDEALDAVLPMISNMDSNRIKAMALSHARETATIETIHTRDVSDPTSSLNIQS